MYFRGIVSEFRQIVCFYDFCLISTPFLKVKTMLPSAFTVAFSTSAFQSWDVKSAMGVLGGFQCFQEADQGAALYLAPVALCLYAFQPVFQFRKSLRHPLILAFILTLVNAASRIAVDERADALRDACHLVAQAGGFFFEAETYPSGAPSVLSCPR